MQSYSNLAPPLISQSPANSEATILDSYVANKKFYLFLKRIADISGSLFFIIAVLSWLTPLVALAIIFESKGPVFFRQRRIGKNGKYFFCLKFRTMIENDEADERQAEENDYRITRVGKFLRHTNIDELPQLINVLRGEMSLIGPRPHMISDCTRFSFVIPAYKFRTLMRPGITGLAQVKGYHGPTADYESIFTRFHWDAEYIRKASPWMDMKIVVKTVLQSFYNLANCFYTKNKEPIAWLF